MAADNHEWDARPGSGSGPVASDRVIRFSTAGHDNTRGNISSHYHQSKQTKPFLSRIDCRSVTNPCNLFYDYFMICKVSILESFMISLIQGTFNKETQIDRNSTKLV